MRIRVKKLDHSCLLVDISNKRLLIDPGEYSKPKLEENKAELKNLDYILITHEHPDHLSPTTINKLIPANPDAKVIAPAEVFKKLKTKKAFTESGGDDNVSVEFSEHEELLDMEIPQNISFTILNKLTHPGDSLKFNFCADILALPVQAPWGSMTSAAKIASDKKPKYIIPIHDWHWKDEAKKSLYQKLGEYFEKSNIKFIDLYRKEEVVVNA